MKRVYEAMLEALARHDRVAVATVVNAEGSTPRSKGAKMVVTPDGSHQFSVGGGLFESIVIEDARQAIVNGQSLLKKYSFNEEGQYAIGAVCGGIAEVLIEVIENQADLLIIGGGHVGQALAKAASLLDFRITVVDDRADFSTALDLGPGIKTMHTSPDFSDIPATGPNAFICIVSKGYASDELALRQVIRRPSKYIGMIGSRKKINRVYDNMEKDGFERTLFEKVHAPIGIEIFSDTPEEIAVSILAQMIQVKNRGRHGS